MRFLILLISLFLVGCGTSVPSIKPYHLDIQQGNVVTSKMLLQLRPGMTKSQVRYIMGTPLIQDSFHGNRWDYFYQMRQDGKIIEQRRVILEFENELLKTVRGDVVPSGTDAKSGAEGANTGTRALEPTGKAEDKGFFDKLKFWKSDDEDKAKPVEAVQPKATKPAEMVKETAPVVSPEAAKVKDSETKDLPAQDLPAQDPAEFNRIDPLEIKTPEIKAPVNKAPAAQAPAPETKPAATEAEKKGLLDKLKFWKSDEPEKATEQAKPSAVDKPEAAESEKKGLLDKLKFWKSDDEAVKKDATPAASDKSEEDVKSLSGVPIIEVPDSK